MISSDTIALVDSLAGLALQNNRTLATAESCTGGLIAAAFTELSGSSAWFDRGFVTYSNDAKHSMLGVATELLANHGAVSEEVVIAMASGAVSASAANIAVSVSGVAGPTGGSAAKPVGTVWIACAGEGVVSVAQHHLFQGDRRSVRSQTVDHAIHLLIKCIKNGSI